MRCCYTGFLLQRQAGENNSFAEWCCTYFIVYDVASQDFYCRAKPVKMIRWLNDVVCVILNDVVSQEFYCSAKPVAFEDDSCSVEFPFSSNYVPHNPNPKTWVIQSMNEWIFWIHGICGWTSEFLNVVKFWMSAAKFEDVLACRVLIKYNNATKRGDSVIMATRLTDVLRISNVSSVWYANCGCAAL